MGRLRRFVVEHEDRWLFVILYVGLAVALSILLTLFWLIVLLAVHIAFEWVASSAHGRTFRQSLSETAWAVKLDAALVLFALALALYMDFLFGLLGLRGLASAGRALQAGSRAAVWSRGIRAALLTADDAVQVARAAARSRSKVPATEPEEPGGFKIGVGDWISIGLGIACLALLLLAPVFTEHTLATAGQAILYELRPWP